MLYNCELCPNNCKIREGQKGTCMVRENQDGNLYLPAYGYLSAISSDPIEKKPLYHYYPGKQIFSAGFYGCNLSCPFCQNYTISKEFSLSGKNYISPDDLVDSAFERGSFGIAYTYSEPIVHFEYVTEAEEYASSLGLKNILVTNGYINDDFSDKLLSNTDAVNVDLKSYNPDFYTKELKGKLEPVLSFIRKAGASVHTEITTLIIPGKNDSEEELRQSAAFIASVNKQIPFHLSAYHPCYKYSIPPTTPSKLMRLAEIASEYLDFVYTGNINSGRADTKCPSCGNTLINRSGYQTECSGIKGGICAICGTPVVNFGIIQELSV
jgi:pyruvate formate lyase activating enzyme